MCSWRKVQADECRPSKKRQTYVEGECTCELVVMNVPYHEVKTDENIRAREAFEELQQRMCITPYAELNLGEDSILEHTKAGYRVSDKVITYLQLGEAYMMCPGIYNHIIILLKRIRNYWDHILILTDTTIGTGTLGSMF